MEYFPNYPVYQYSNFNHGQYFPATGLQYHPGVNAEAWRRHSLMHHGARTTESKPRLAKDEVDKLEQEFQRNHKPNSSLKKQLAEEMRVDIARINNWFQNRRAKAKQEKRARENEARRKSEQATEKPVQDAVKEYYADDDHTDDLRPSAAPFLPADNQIPTMSRESVEDPSEGAQELSQDAETDATSPKSTIPQAQEQSLSDYASTDGFYYPSQSPRDFSSAATSENTDCQSSAGPLTLAIPTQFTPDMQDSSSASSYAPFRGLPSSDGMDSIGTMSPQYGSGSSANFGQLDLGEDHQDSLSNLNHLSPESTHSPMSVGSGLQFKSPPVDIASRRNTKRPAQISTGSMRSYSYNHPGMKTGIEMTRRTENSSPMRRVASATGNMPRGVQKPMGAIPRSPLYFDRNKELLLQMASRTPVAQGPGNTAAPPTPNTPVIVNQQVGELGVPSSCEDDKHLAFSSGLPVNNFNLDPTMSTPPDTPSLMGNLSVAVFPGNHLQATFDYSVPDEPLITPGLGSFENEFPSISDSLPGYISHGGASQPSTPSYPPSSMGPAFFPSYAGGNAEYNWSDVSARPSSPTQPNKARQFQFTNMTAQDFHCE